MFKLLTQSNFTTQQKSLRYLQDEHLGNIINTCSLLYCNVFHLKYIDTHWKGISENTVTLTMKQASLTTVTHQNLRCG